MTSDKTGVTVAALQMVSGADLDANIEQAERLLAQAAAAGANIAVLPETFGLFASGAQRSLGEQEASAAAVVRPFLAGAAGRHGLYIVAGTVPVCEPGDERPYAACFIYDDRGAELDCYHKIHLFDVDVADGQGRYCESSIFRPGNRAVVVPTPWGGLGLAVCYDLRFPELFQALRLGGADMIAVPAAFTRHTGLAHWLPLLRARAIETQCLLVGANQGGVHTSKRQTSGGSVIIDAWGDVQAEAGFGPACVTGRFDRSRQDRLRQSMPVVAHRRFGIGAPAPAG